MITSTGSVEGSSKMQNGVLFLAVSFSFSGNAIRLYMYLFIFGEEEFLNGADCGN